MDAASLASPSTLACLGDRPAPPEMASDLRCLFALPEPARHRLWEALGPSLREPIPDGVEARLDEFCRKNGVDDALLARALKASRHLVRAAVARGLPRDRLAADIVRLLGEADAGLLSPLLLAGYDAATIVVRAELTQRTLAEHRDLVTRLHYRVEQVIASSHADSLGARLLTLVLEKSSGERVTVTFGQEQIAELARACERAAR